MIKPIFFFLLLLFGGTVTGFSQADICIDQFEITGNKKTKDFVILRELKIKKDSCYTKESFAKLIQHSEWLLMNTNLFNEVVVTQIDNRLHIHVLEKWYLWPIPFAEFADRSFQQWRLNNYDPSRLNYGLYLFLYNFRGRNETLKFSFVAGYNRKFELNYRIPILGNHRKWGLETQLKYIDNNEVWVKTAQNELQFFNDNSRVLTHEQVANIQLIYRPFYWWRLQAGPTFRHAFVKDTVLSNSLNPNYFFNGNQQAEFGFKLMAEFDNRDNKYNALSGLYFQWANHLYFTNNNHYQNTTELRFSLYQPLTERLFASTGFAGFAHFSDAYSYYNQKLLGYDDYVRGYENFVIDGRYGGWQKNEFRIALIKEKVRNTPFVPLKAYKRINMGMYWSAFFDQGYAFTYNIRNNNSLNNRWMYALGTGLNIVVLNDQILRIEYALNRERLSGIYFHFSAAI